MSNLTLALLSGVLGAVVLSFTDRVRSGIRNTLTLAFALSGAWFTWQVALAVMAGESVGLTMRLGGLTWSLRADPLGVVFGLIVSSLWVLATVYSFGYMNGEPRQRTYYTFFLLSFAVTLGVAFSGNLLTLYLCYELLTFATYPLVIHQRDEEAVKAGSKYIIYSLSGAGAILVAMVVTYLLAGSLEFTGRPLLAAVDRRGLGWLLALFVAGFGVKAALMPLHRWLPAAMVAPTPVSALLHAVAVVNSGVFGLLRVIYSIFGPELVSQLAWDDGCPGSRPLQSWPVL